MLKIILYPDKQLTNRICQEVTFPLSDELKLLIDQMIDTMYLNNGVGLSANQVGIFKKIFVIDPTMGEEGDKLKILINPKIVKKSKETIFSKEGCLSIPGVLGEVQRSEEVWIEYQDLDGKKQRMIAQGFAASVIQHEYDHLDNKLFIDHLKPLTKKMVMKNYSSLSLI